MLAGKLIYFSIITFIIIIIIIIVIIIKLYRY